MYTIFCSGRKIDTADTVVTNVFGEVPPFSKLNVLWECVNHIHIGSFGYIVLHTVVEI